jgi:Na+/melibiose symporter-like transporter
MNNHWNELDDILFLLTFPFMLFVVAIYPALSYVIGKDCAFLIIYLWAFVLFLLWLIRFVSEIRYQIHQQGDERK